MSTELEIALRVPKAKDPIRDASGYPIDNRSVRFIKRIVVDSLPKVGDLLPLTTKSGEAFDGSITRVQLVGHTSTFVFLAPQGRRPVTSERLNNREPSDFTIRDRASVRPSP